MLGQASKHIRNTSSANLLKHNADQKLSDTAKQADGFLKPAVKLPFDVQLLKNIAEHLLLKTVQKPHTKWSTVRPRPSSNCNIGMSWATEHTITARMQQKKNDRIITMTLRMLFMMLNFCVEMKLSSMMRMDMLTSSSLT